MKITVRCNVCDKEVDDYMIIGDAAMLREQVVSARCHGEHCSFAVTVPDHGGRKISSIGFVAFLPDRLTAQARG